MFCYDIRAVESQVSNLTQLKIYEFVYNHDAHKYAITSHLELSIVHPGTCQKLTYGTKNGYANSTNTKDMFTNPRHPKRLAWWYLSNKINFQKTFEELFIREEFRTLLVIFFKS